MTKNLNLGCGARFHPAWTNVDFVQTGEHVIAYDLTRGIPYDNESFEVVYHSHLLEHFPKNFAETFLYECHRVLAPGGIIRVVVPDLEQIVHQYLTTLARATTNSTEWSNNYEWIMLELYDQAVRNQSGGEMETFLAQEKLPNKQFILKRCGIGIEHSLERGRSRRHYGESDPRSKHTLNRYFKQIWACFRSRRICRELLLRVFLGYNDYHALQVGRFRKSGEVHQWMYDRHSLAVLLKQCGFHHISQCSAIQSTVPNWTTFNLDTEPDGTVHKPDSLYMEGIKPDVS